MGEYPSGNLGLNNQNLLHGDRFAPIYTWHGVTLGVMIGVRCSPTGRGGRQGEHCLQRKLIPW